MYGNTFVLDLGYVYKITSLLKSGTDSKDFPIDSDIVPFSSSSDGKSEEDLALSIRDETPFDQNILNVEEVERIPDLPEEDRDEDDHNEDDEKLIQRLFRKKMTKVLLT